jgi:hypothetical protein
VTLARIIFLDKIEHLLAIKNPKKISSQNADSQLAHP